MVLRVGDLGKFGVNATLRRFRMAGWRFGRISSLDTLPTMRRSATLIAILFAMLWHSAAFTRLGTSVLQAGGHR
jgi:hypothetical protein